MQNGFFALMSRLKNITRWSLMRNSAPENVQEHSHMVAVIAHALAVIRRDVLGVATDPGAVAAAALFHDASEIFTGDLPTPIKYFNPEIMTAYKRVESTASQKLLLTLPEELRSAYEPLLSASSGVAGGGVVEDTSAGGISVGDADTTGGASATGNADDNGVRSLVKAADTLAAYIKCLEEQRAGNLEFRRAAKQSLDKLEALCMPEVAYFIEHFIPAFELTLDDMDFSFE